MLTNVKNIIRSISIRPFDSSKHKYIATWWPKNLLYYGDIVDTLKDIYKSKLLPLEEAYLFHEFHSPRLANQDFDAKPIIIFIGQYSTGKTTLLRYILGKDFPGLRIGPEPTTDRFIVLMKGEKDGIIPGNALVADHTKPFKALSHFGNSFLKRIQCTLLNSPVLESVTLVDTPGILSGEKQRVARGYDFEKVLEWFSERADRIMLLFDANKLDISDELQRTIEALNVHDEKIKIILNKADSIDSNALIRVYGALMWSLGKVLKTPEVSRVYVGSFWENPLLYDTNRNLFHEEEQELLKDIQSLPRFNILRKINDLNKRARLALVHSFIISELSTRMPFFLKKDKKKHELIQNLEHIFFVVKEKYNVSEGDFPDVYKMKEKLSVTDFSRFPSLNTKLMKQTEAMMTADIAYVMNMLPSSEEDLNSKMYSNIKGGIFTDVSDVASPFGHYLGTGIDEGRGEPVWIINKSMEEYESTFNSLSPIDGKLLLSATKEEFEKSKLPNSTLAKIWLLSDIDKDGQLDLEEFALAKHLIKVKTLGYDLPDSLPTHLIPPNKKTA